MGLKRRKMKKNAGKPLYYYLLADLLGVLFTMVPVLASWTVAILFARHSLSEGCPWLAILTPFVACFTLFIIQFAVYLVLPRLKPGVYRLGPNAMCMSWIAQLNLARCASVAGLRALIFSSGILRFLYFNSLGAKFSYRATLSLNVDAVDYPLISIGPDSLIGDRTEISCHTVTSRHLKLGTVRVDARAFVSAFCKLGYNTHLKEDSYVGLENIVYAMTLGEGERIKDFQFNQGPKTPPAAGPATT